MKAIGIVRKVDRLGRIVIPIELRRKLGIEIGSPLEIYTNEDSIILKPYTPSQEHKEALETLDELAKLFSGKEKEKIKKIKKMIK